ncbi:MAG: type II toxin-antitoxin system RelE/ParE family toxin [Bacteroidetes bacterium]|nr:type II toxin-antitoxin system RelE/ParE family toxin [Bacteroidota bacterium]
MSKRKIKVVYKRAAADSITSIGDFIAHTGYPQTAGQFIQLLYDFGNSLADFPEKYPVCRKQDWAKRNLRCAIFRRDYIFIYRILKNELTIYNVVHARTIA